MLKKIFDRQINSITIAAFLVATSSLVSRLLGIFRDRILASEFGASESLDVYYAAFRIPDFLFNIIVLGALSAGFIPIFTHLIKEKKEKAKEIFGVAPYKEAWFLANNVLNILVVTLFVISLGGILLSSPITKLLAPGFSIEQKMLTSELTKIMFLSPIFLGISSVLGGILQSFKRFFIYSLAPIFYNVGIIIGALYFVPRFGIYGLAWGVVLGAFLHMIIQIPASWSLGFRYKPSINFKSADVKKIGSMMIPRTLSLGISQINLLVITIISSTLAIGSLTIFNFANNLQSFPIGIFGISFAIAAFPTLSAAAFDKKKLVLNFSTTIRQILFFIVPSTVLLITLRAQIIRVILGAGNFDWQATVQTIDTLGFFALSLFAQATLPLLTRVFYARHNSKTPFFVGLATAVLNVGLSLWLSGRLGVAGLALAFSIANIINFILLWVILRIEIGDMDEFKILFSTIKFSIAGIALGVTVQAMKLLIWAYIDMTTFAGVFLQGFIAGVFGLFVYLAVCSLLGSEELLDFWQSISRRLPWNKVEAGDQGEARGI